MDSSSVTRSMFIIFEMDQLLFSSSSPFSILDQMFIRSMRSLNAILFIPSFFFSRLILLCLRSFFSQSIDCPYDFDPLSWQLPVYMTHVRKSRDPCVINLDRLLWKPMNIRARYCCLLRCSTERVLARYA